MSFFNMNPIDGASWADESEQTLSKSSFHEEPINEPIVEESNQEELVKETKQYPSREIPNSGPYTCFVGNLPYEMLEKDVEELLFETEIKNVNMPMDHAENRKRGFAYVEFMNRESLVKALEYNGNMLSGRRIKVDVALERKNNNYDGKKKFNQYHGAPQVNEEDTMRFFHKKSSSGESDNNATHENVEKDESVAQRPKLKLLPRKSNTTEKVEKQEKGRKSSIFGQAKPRDESKYLERKKSMDETTEPKAILTKDEDKKTNAEGRTARRSSFNKDTMKSYSGYKGNDRSKDAHPKQIRNKKNVEKKINPDMIKKMTITKVVTEMTNPFAALDDEESSSDSE